MVGADSIVASAVAATCVFVFHLCCLPLALCTPLFEQCAAPSYSLSSFPTIRYVSPTGSDSSNGLSAFTAWATLSKASSSASAGMTIIVASGVYNERLTITASGTAGSPIIFISASAVSGSGATGRAVIDGSGLTVSSAAADALVMLNSNNAHVQLIGFEIRNFKTTNVAAVPYGIYMKGTGNNVLIRGNYFHNIQQDCSGCFTSTSAAACAIYIQGSSSSTAVSNVVLDYNEVTAIGSANLPAVILDGNINGFQANFNFFHDNPNVGLQIQGGFGAVSTAAADHARNGLVYKNTFYNHSAVQNPFIHVSYSVASLFLDGAQNVVVDGNLFSANDFGFALEANGGNSGNTASALLLQNNIMWAQWTTGGVIGDFASGSPHAVANASLKSNVFFQNNQAAAQVGAGELELENSAQNFLIQSCRFFNSDLGGFNGAAIFTSSVYSAETGMFISNTFSTISSKSPQWHFENIQFTALNALENAAPGSSGNTFTTVTSAPASICAFGVSCDANGLPVLDCADAYSQSGQFTTPAAVYTTTTLTPTTTITTTTTLQTTTAATTSSPSTTKTPTIASSTTTTTTTTTTATPAPVNRCLGYSCINGATCVPNFFNFPICSCASGFYGLHCQYSLAAPAPIFPSVNGALVCQHGSALPSSASVCDCSSAAGNFTGNDCSIAYTRMGFALNTTLSNVAAATGFDQIVDNALNTAFSAFGVQPVAAALVSVWGVSTSFESVAADSSSRSDVWVNVDIVQQEGTDWNTTNAAKALLNPANPPVIMIVNGVLCTLQRAQLQSNTPQAAQPAADSTSSLSILTIVLVSVGCSLGLVLVVTVARVLYARTRRRRAGFQQSVSSLGKGSEPSASARVSTTAASTRSKEDTRKFPWRKGLAFGESNSAL